jgi:hypothetical protein
MLGRVCSGWQALSQQDHGTGLAYHPRAWPMSKQTADAAFTGRFGEACQPEMCSQRAFLTSGAASNVGTVLEVRSAIGCDGAGL